MNSNAMQQALTAAMPDLQERVPLARQIDSVEQVEALGMEELELLHAEHEAECVELTGRIEAAPDTLWARRARQALRILYLHKHWISREVTKRKKAAAFAAQKHDASTSRETRLLVQREMAERMRQAEAARLARIKASNDETARHIAVFKEVARDVLGAEMYEHLWELTRIRLGQ